MLLVKVFPSSNLITFNFLSFFTSSKVSLIYPSFKNPLNTIINRILSLFYYHRKKNLWVFFFFSFSYIFFYLFFIFRRLIVISNLKRGNLILTYSKDLEKLFTRGFKAILLRPLTGHNGHKTMFYVALAERGRGAKKS